MGSDAGYGPSLPGPEHELLRPFRGVFLATVRIWTGPAEPLVQSGIMRSEFVLSGLYLFQDYTGFPAPEPWPSFLGKGFWGFNSTTREYESFWIDNASTTMQLERGSVDDSGRIWTMKSEFVHPHTRARYQKRTVVRLLDENRNDMTSWLAGVDGREFKSMEISFERS